MPLSASVLFAWSVFCLVVGCLLGWLGQRGRLAAQQGSIAELASENKLLQGEASSAVASAAANEASAKSERERASRLEEERKELLRRKDEAEARATAAETQLREERGQAERINNDRDGLANQFEVLASRILDEKTKVFTEHSHANIGDLLNPLREKIADFQTKVEEVQKDGNAGRVEMRAQIDNLRMLNDRLSQEATNLVSALKGSSKVQGDWGEFILEGLLEASGLRKGHEYLPQESVKRENGRGARLDVIVNLPGGRHLVIDSKVSLSGYSEYCGSAEGLVREAALARHLASVRGHLRGLSERNYQSLYGLRSLDFVVMFVPIEPAFMLAIAHDSQLWNDGWKKNVLLVSPSTLLFVVRTVAHLWRQEQQTQNAKQIARRGAELYDKFVGFVDDLKGVGERLAQARNAYDSAYGKLSGGQGNLVRQAELLRELGVKPKKALSLDLVGSAFEGDDGDEGEVLELAAVAESGDEDEG